MYNLSDQLENRYNLYEPLLVNNNTSGSTALYHHKGTRYGLGLVAPGTSGQDSRMNGLHGPKCKREDADQECR